RRSSDLFDTGRAGHLPGPGPVAARPPAISHVEVLRFLVQRHDRVGGLLGMKLVTLGQFHTDPTGLQQLLDLRAVLEVRAGAVTEREARTTVARSEEHTSELQSRFDLVCRLL